MVQTTKSSPTQKKITGKRSLRKRKTTQKFEINSLPNDLLIDVLSLVASCSFTDFFNAKLTCRKFLRAANEDCIYEKISMDKFPVIPWFANPEILEFLRQCREKGNPEALYREGMIDYFSHKKPELGFVFLKRAVEKHHADAIYTYGMILLCLGNEDEERGKKILEHLNSDQIKLFRKRTIKIIWNMWVDNEGVANNIRRYSDDNHNRSPCDCFVGKGWEKEDEDYDKCCKACFWERECTWFRNMF